MPKLTIDTKESLFKPIEVEIDGKVFEVKRFTRAVAQEVEKLDTQIQGGKLDAAYRQLEIFLGENKAIGNLDLNQVNEITRFIVKNIISPEPEEKNEPKPGDSALPS